MDSCPTSSVRSARKLGVFDWSGHLIMKLTSNTILITGGSSGIGYELTRQLTALGNTILITGRDQAKLDRAKAAFSKVHTLRRDVSDPKAIATLYEKVTNQFPELTFWSTTPASCVRSTFTTKLEASKTSLERLKSI